MFLNILISEDKIFIEEYIYKGSDYDSKVTARANALEQVTEKLLRKVGVYIKSETIWDKKETKDGIQEIYEKNINVITAGTTKIEVIDEKWSENEYWVKAEIIIDPSNIQNKIDELINDKEDFREYLAIKEERNKAFKEIERLKQKLNQVKSDEEKNEIISSYNKQFGKLSSKQLYERGYKAIRNKKYNKAISLMLEAKNLNPDDFAVYKHLGYSYYVQGNRTQSKKVWKEGLKKLRGLIKKDKKNSNLHIELARYYVLIKENVLAEKSYSKAMKFNKDNSEIICEYGMFLFKNYGDTPYITKLLRKASKLGAEDCQEICRNNGFYW